MSLRDFLRVFLYLGIEAIFLWCWMAFLFFYDWLSLGLAHFLLRIFSAPLLVLAIVGHRSLTVKTPSHQPPRLKRSRPLPDPLPSRNLPPAWSSTPLKKSSER